VLHRPRSGATEPDSRLNLCQCKSHYLFCESTLAPEEVLEGIRQVVADAVADMEASDEAMPEPIALRHYSGKFTVRILPDLHRRLALEAAESGVSLNRLASAKLSK